jgi:hypothetical protein
VATPANNRVLTSDGTTNAAVAEQNLTFDGSILSVVGTVTLTNQLNLTYAGGSYRLNTRPLDRLFNNGDYYGETIVLSNVNLTVGSVYYFTSSSTWALTDADTAAQSRNLLGIATAYDETSSPLLIRGFFKNTSWSFTVGAPVYLSTTAGSLTSTQPTGAGDIVRVVGYAIAADELYFNPSQDWVELA